MPSQIPFIFCQFLGFQFHFGRTEPDRGPETPWFLSVELSGVFGLGLIQLGF